MLKNEQIVSHKKLMFFALQSNVILHQRHSRMVNIALFYVSDCKCGS